ncbi:hypothetical protein GCM10010123_42110 [Pilimelia anulata]|uniref:Uncharacterized protein n=1 Tax=Pilimelia anulata TaxID=53371 RepID=A0A8J3BFY7_9ACTN|nr:hypothetical protein GCM10010123_42110 [Pilimelia anulata]
MEAYTPPPRGDLTTTLGGSVKPNPCIARRSCTAGRAGTAPGRSRPGSRRSAVAGIEPTQGGVHLPPAPTR